MTKPDPAVIAFDIGGATLKAADGLGWIHSEPFELWRRSSQLSDRLAHILKEACPRRVVATMTGEIADCYPSRQAGVRQIVESLTQAMQVARLQGSPEFYAVDGSLISADEALACPLSIAAANWHAVARLAAAFCTTDRALMIDIGSTTTDIIAIADRVVLPLASDDFTRMASGELVYTGVERTPIAAIVRSLPLRGTLHPVASELFAQSQDVWLLLGGLLESDCAHPTADGGPVTRDAARIRMARMMLADPELVSLEDALAAAEFCAQSQSQLLARSFSQVIDTIGWQPTCLVLSGHGECLARKVIEHFGLSGELVSLPNQLGRDLSRVAPAHALALIARGLLA
ncbi:MAG: hypothetical protein DWI25_06735 [Planctomycetota bacterium]|nr:MAG: hypothetical protein DWI25_06735 [Planctomycetota bacterium]